MPQPHFISNRQDTTSTVGHVCKIHCLHHTTTFGTKEIAFVGDPVASVQVCTRVKILRVHYNYSIVYNGHTLQGKRYCRLGGGIR